MQIRLSFLRDRSLFCSPLLARSANDPRNDLDLTWTMVNQFRYPRDFLATDTPTLWAHDATIDVIWKTPEPSTQANVLSKYR